MSIIYILVIIYFFAGCAVLVFSVWPIGNKFSKFIVNKFDSPSSFNKFLTHVWLYPSVIALFGLLIMTKIF